MWRLISLSINFYHREKNVSGGEEKNIDRVIEKGKVIKVSLHLM